MEYGWLCIACWLLLVLSVGVAGGWTMLKDLVFSGPSREKAERRGFEVKLKTGEPPVPRSEENDG
jgi:hypothetical protein